jgi:transcriptional antiterminator RfaH
MGESKYFWYALYTKFNSEKKISKILSEMNVENYLPIRTVVKHWCDREKLIDEPLFKSYLFVRVSQIEFFDVLSLSGVHSYVSFGGKAQAIPDLEIEAIKEMVSKCNDDLSLSYEFIKSGVEVEILEGPLTGFCGEVCEIDGEHRIVVRVNTLGCSIHTHVTKENLKLIS